MSITRPRNARLQVRTADDGLPSVLLNDMELAGLLAADGFNIAPASEPDEYGWVVEMKFSSGALELDFDVELLQTLLAEAEAKAK